MNSPLRIISYKTIRLYSLLQLSAEPLTLLISYLNYQYGEEKNKASAFSYMSFVMSLIVIIFSSLLAILSKKCGKPAPQYFVLMLISIIYFELLMGTKHVYQAYFMFLFIYSFTKNLSLYIEFKIYAILGIHLFIYAYHIFRAFFIDKTVTNFPLFSTFTLITGFIILDVPFFYVLQRNMCFIKQQEYQIQSIKLLIDMVPSPFFIYKESRIHFANQMANSIFTHEELERIVIDSNILQLSVILNYSFKSKIYSLKSIKYSLNLYEKESFIISIIDNTEIVNIEKNIATENAKWLFINSTCHQVRTPVSCIESSLNLLEKSISEKDNTGIQNFIDLSLISCFSLRHIIDDSIFLCEDSNSGIVVHSSTFKFDDIIKEIQSRFHYETITKSISFLVEEKKYPFKVCTDQKLLLHSIYTLLMNSFKYTFTGKIYFNHNITSSGKGSKLDVEIIDTGIGIKDTDKCQIFNVFSQSDVKKVQNSTANGVGLYIVKRIITLLNGGITFTSEVGKESKFSFWIPLEVKYDDVSPKIEGSPKNLRFSKKQSNHSVEQKKVLIVDDNATNVFILSSMLTRLSVQCDKAHNGLEAVKMYEQNGYALILMDINMPVMNGYEASKKIKEWASSKKKDVEIVAVSAQNEPLNESLSSNGIDEWVEKPVRFDTLSKIVGSKFN